MSLGLAPGQVSLAQRHEAWAVAYQRDRAAILAALGESIVAVEHVGSTSIPNVPAKPILDILVGVNNFEEAQICVAPMLGIGYRYRGEYGIPRRHYFVKGQARTHHIHMLEIHSPRWAEMLRFRDAMRANSSLAAEYAREKVRLAELHADNRQAYQRGKDRAVERILAKLD